MKKRNRTEVCVSFMTLPFLLKQGRDTVEFASIELRAKKLVKL